MAGEWSAQQVLDAGSARFLRRHDRNPILTRHDIGGGSSCVLNPAMTNFAAGIPRCCADIGEWGEPELERTDLNLAYSSDGVTWEVKPPCFEYRTEEVNDAYDPRLTVMEDDGKAYLAFAADAKHGFVGGLARTDDFVHWETFGLSTPDNRDFVLFPRSCRMRRKRGTATTFCSRRPRCLRKAAR